MEIVKKLMRSEIQDLQTKCNEYFKVLSDVSLQHKINPDAFFQNIINQKSYEECPDLLMPNQASDSELMSKIICGYLSRHSGFSTAFHCYKALQ